MSVETWIKTLNARLLTEPNWTFKAGYLAALIAASLFLAAFLMLRVTFSFIGIVLAQLAKPARYNETEEDEHKDNATVAAIPTFYDNNVVGVYDDDYDDRLTGYE